MSQPSKPSVNSPTQSAGVSSARNKFTFSIGSILIITFVVALVGFLLGRMVIAIRSNSSTSVGYFAILAALVPSASLAVAGTMFRVFQWLKERNS